MLANPLAAQSSYRSSVFRQLFSKDSLLFEVGFNACDVTQFETLLAENFEFYHDKSGITSSKADFVKSIRDGLCMNALHPMRKLVAGSMEVFPLYQDGNLYGAIQNAKHRFFERMENGISEFRSIASFTHLWILEEGEWKLKRCLSFDHQTQDCFKDGRQISTNGGL